MNNDRLKEFSKQEAEENIKRQKEIELNPLSQYSTTQLKKRAKKEGKSMKIENETLYINKTDLDHILEEMDLQEYLSVPPSDLFLEGLATELSLSGLLNETFKKIAIDYVWE